MASTKPFNATGILQLEKLIEQNKDGWTALHYAAEAGTLHLMPAEYLTVENLLVGSTKEVRLSDSTAAGTMAGDIVRPIGTTPMHNAASRGYLAQVPVGVLTEESLLTQDSVGSTPVHCAARCGMLDKFPKSKLNERNMLVEDDAGYSPLHRAAYAGQLNHVPASLLTLSNMSRSNVSGLNSLHFAAVSLVGMEHVPNELVTLDNLLIRGNVGQTVLHMLTRCHNLGTIPSGFLTQSTIMERDIAGETVLHFAAGCLDAIPAELLSVENLLVKNNDGVTPLHKVVAEGTLDALLAVDLGDSSTIREIVGDDWWNRYLSIRAGKAGLEELADPADIDIF